MKYFFVFICCFLIISCADNNESTFNTQEVTKILEQAEEAIFEHQGISIDSMMQLRMDYHYKSKQYKHPVHIFRSHFYLGDFYQSRGIYNEAMSEYEKALSAAAIEDKDSTRFIQTKVAMATTEIELGDKQKAAKILLDTYEVAARNNDKQQLLNINGNMGVLSLELKKYVEAKKSFKKAIDFIERELLLEKDSINQVVNYINYHMFMAKTYQREKNLDSAMFYIDKGIVNTTFFNDEEGKAYLLLLKGEVYTAQHKFEKAYESLQLGKKLFNDLKNEMQVSKIMHLIGNYHYMQNDYEKSLEILEEVEHRYAAKKALIEDYCDVLALKSENYKALKQFEKESIHRQKTAVIKDSMHLANGNETVLRTATEYEIEKIKNKYEAQHQKDENTLYIFLILFLLIILLIGIVSYRLKNRVAVATTEPVKQKVSQKAIKSDKTVEEILLKLKKLEAEEFYLNPDYNLYATAKKIETNTTYLSTILNTHKKMTFTEYLNTLRIQYTLDRLKNDPKFRKYAIKAIAKEVGYKSHGSFSRAFKAKTGENPSTYLKKLES